MGGSSTGVEFKRGFVLFCLGMKDKMFFAHRNDPIKRQDMMTLDGESCGPLGVFPNF